MQVSLEKLEKELSGLHTTLTHAVRERKISSRQYAARQTCMAGLEKEIHRIRSLFNENAEPETLRTPLLQTNMTDEERQRSMMYLEEKFIFLHTLLRKIEKIQNWIIRSEKSKLMQLCIPLQLTWLNKEIKKLEHKMVQAEDLEIELNQFIENLSNQISPSILRNSKRDSLRKIMDLLAQQDQLQRRICMKQEVIQAKHLEISELQQSIQSGRDYRQSPSKLTNLPTASATHVALMDIGGKYLTNLQNCKKKIEIVKKFLDSMIRDEPESFHMNSEDSI